MISFEEACKIAKKEIGELYREVYNLSDCWIFYRSDVDKCPIGNIPLGVCKSTGKFFGVDIRDPHRSKMENAQMLKLPANY